MADHAPTAPERARPKVLLAPMNFAAMPVTLAKALQSRGYEAAHIQYTGEQGNRLAFELDRTVNIRGADGHERIQMRTVADALAEGFDIFHFWNRSLVFRTDYSGFSGLDIPLIKARGRKIAHRFTGFDLRLPSRDLAVNPHSPFRYDQQPFFDEDLVRAYQDFLREYVDRFFVQDPEMAQFFPEADIIPRALNLSEWDFVGVERKARPLVVHAPTNPQAKGTKFILAAVETLRERGLAFDFKLVQNMAHADAKQIYRSADVIVDQILIGATGVLTLEAWALGKPVVVNLRRDLFEPFYETNDLPVINANPDDIVPQLEKAIKDADYRLELSRRGRDLVERRHDIADVIDQYVAAYESIHAAPMVTPTGDRDFEYFTRQLILRPRPQTRVLTRTRTRHVVRPGFWQLWTRRYKWAYSREIERLKLLRPRARPSLPDRVGAGLRTSWPLIRVDARNIWRGLTGRREPKP